MSSKYLHLVVLLLVYGYAKPQNTFVPDAIFEQALIDKGYDTGPLDNLVPTANINTIIDLDVSQLNINDLTGIEDFSSLEVLDCSENRLSALDISQNTNLKQLFCAFNRITSLDISNNIGLSIIWCNFNRIPVLDVSNNTGLLSLVCSNNLLTEIDVSNNLSLNTFLCVGNQISSFDVSLNSNLKVFHCSNNRLTEVDVTNNPALNVLNCEYNFISTLDLSQNPALQQLYCMGNMISSLDLFNNGDLGILSCGNNMLYDLDVSRNPNLVELICNDNTLTTLELNRNGSLNHIDVANNSLCNLNIKNRANTNVTFFDARENPDLFCVFVDDPRYSALNWTNIEPITNFVTNQEECDEVADITPDVDILNDFFGNQFILPTLNDGSYFTGSNGTGQPLFSGEIITVSQTIYIFNTNGCYSNESRFNVIISSPGSPNYFIPKYFTPNNDGEHDFWGIVDTFNEINHISIYNRNGKLLKFLLPSSKWDGIFNGQLLPSDTYWYEIVLNSGGAVRGYFALKR
ncbi:T9SS type B sorting domain-containing protein [Hyunsoonleella rubra]|uniref:T9SS type B sorting domain-containing protein n=1 Tax=Hyunsoonleella rubra TaxID=1737062 RepID=A0ABW5T9A2_9FLAO